MFVVGLPVGNRDVDDFSKLSGGFGAARFEPCPGDGEEAGFYEAEVVVADALGDMVGLHDGAGNSLLEEAHVALEDGVGFIGQEGQVEAGAGIPRVQEGFQIFCP